MLRLLFLATSLTFTIATTSSPAAVNSSLVTAPNDALVQAPIWTLGDRPKDCPPCFNCLLPAFNCKQFADCSAHNGLCECPPGFAGEDCLQPLCGSLGAGNHRPAKGDEPCKCDKGWEGINCNVCKTDDACNALMPLGTDGVCYKQGITIKENFQQCDVTNKKILEMLKKHPQVTFSCSKEKAECTFQFWVDQRESFYCDLTKCDWSLATSHDKNVTNYGCEKVQCECIPGRALCGEGGFIDLGEFLKQEIKGPAKFSCDSSMNSDQCMFSEPNMNGIITSIFGDETILLDCSSGECLHKSEVPGYTRPVKTINKPLIAFAIAGSALFLVMAVLALWWMSRRASQRVGNGPISLDDDDQALNLITEHNPAALHFRNISYFVNGRQILKNVRGAVSPGKVMAIMGASGAGKTTFLDLLARKNKRGQVNGDFFVNGSKVSDTDYKGIIGFVDQEDTMLATLTVYETILNSALLRLPKDMAYEAKNKRVMEVIAQLGITGIKDQMIGSSTDNAVRGISGGEKRRVGIACELVTSPSILFLDEPTSGLDSFNAYNVIECLVNLAKNYQRTVIFTIHQPKSNIVALFDELVLLAKGECVYSGPFNKCQDYFDTQGYPCPPGFNIADYLVDLTVHAEQRRAFPVDDLAPINGGISAVKHNNAKAQHLRPRKRGSSIRDLQAQQLFTRKSTDIPSRHFNEDGVILSEGMMSPRASVDEAEAHLLPSARKEMDRTDLDVLIESYNTSDIGKAIQDEFENASTGQPNSAAGINGVSGLGNGKVFERLGWIGQFMILSQRTWKNLYRNPMLMLAHYAVSIVLAVLCGYLFFAVRDDISGFQNRLGLFFFILALFGFSTLTSLNVFAHERTLFLRERANGYYAPITYFTAKVLFDVVPLRIIPPIIMGMIVYPMVGLVSEWPEFFKFIIVLVLFNLAASAICLFIGIVCKDNSVGNLVGSLVMLFSLLFAGLLLNHNSIPSGALWLQRLSIFHYAFEALIVNEVRYLSLVEHKFGLDIEVPGATILSTFGFDSLAYWNDVLGLAVFSLSFIVFAYIAMHFLLVEKR